MTVADIDARTARLEPGSWRASTRATGHASSRREHGRPRDGADPRRGQHPCVRDAGRAGRALGPGTSRNGWPQIASSARWRATLATAPRRWRASGAGAWSSRPSACPGRRRCTGCSPCIAGRRGRRGLRQGPRTAPGPLPTTARRRLTWTRRCFSDARALETGASPAPIDIPESRMVRRLGTASSTATAASSAAPAGEPAGPRAGVRTSDVTEQRRAEAEIRRLNDELQRRVVEPHRTAGRRDEGARGARLLHRPRRARAAAHDRRLQRRRHGGRARAAQPGRRRRAPARAHRRADAGAPARRPHGTLARLAPRAAAADRST